MSERYIVRESSSPVTDGFEVYDTVTDRKLNLYSGGLTLSREAAERRAASLNDKQDAIDLHIPIVLSMLREAGEEGVSGAQLMDQLNTLHLHRDVLEELRRLGYGIRLEFALRGAHLEKAWLEHDLGDPPDLPSPETGSADETQVGAATPDADPAGHPPLGPGGASSSQEAA